MTKLRRAGTFARMRSPASCGALSAEGAGAVIGKSGSLIRAAADPDNDHQLNLTQALALDLAYQAAGHGEAPIYRAYRHRVLLHGPAPHDAADPVDRFMDVTREHGELAGELRAAAHDLHWTAVERNRVLAAIAEARAELDRLERDVEVIAAGPQIVRAGR